MKRIISLCISIALSVQGLYASCPESCSQEKVILSGNLITQTLNASTVYLLRSCVVVPNNVVLTVPAGTIIMGEKATNGTLLIERGGKFISQGTSIDPVIITSDQSIECRAPGDYGGMVVAGHAPNNTGGNLSINRGTCNAIVAGGINTADNSGVFRFMRIEYASTGLSMLSVGDQTVLENVQISHAGFNGMELYGGNVNARELAFYDNYGNDIEISLGNQSKLQQVLIVRKNPLAYTLPASTAVLIKNNDDAINNYASAPGTLNTHPVMSNFTILGPEQCGSISNNYYNGVEFRNNAEGAFYNSYIDGVNIGLQVNGNETVDNANRTVAPALFFAYNSFFQNRNEATSDVLTWLGGCAGSIDTWLAGLLCSQQAIETGQAENLNSTTCGDYCSTAPLFAVSASDLDFPEYTMLDPSFFTEPDNRGAFGTANWVNSWAQFCTPNYCPAVFKTSATSDLNEYQSGLRIFPNPASQFVHIRWNALAYNQTAIRIVNVLGQEVYSQTLNEREMSHTVNIDGWASGVYFVQCIQEGVIMGAQSFVVK